jgi:hypothetical protein
MPSSHMRFSNHTLKFILIKLLFAVKVSPNHTAKILSVKCKISFRIKSFRTTVKLIDTGKSKKINMIFESI